MKANQKFTQADEAVSPVIGVILMVAITVVLAAVVFVLVSDLGESGDSAPQMSFQKNEADDRLRVISSAAVDWSEIGVSISDDDNTVCGTDLDSKEGAVTAGDVLQISNTGVGTAGTCTVSLSHTPSNSLLGSWDFTVPDA